MTAPRSCRRCRSLKLKCDREDSGCARCLRAEQECTYAVPPKALQIRDQTDKAERHAIAAWRARAKNITEPTQDVGRPTRPAVAVLDLPTERPLPTDFGLLARHRFIYDFSKSGTSLSALALEGKSPYPAAVGEDRCAGSAVESAMFATALANFHARHYDLRAAQLARTELGKALAILQQTMRDPRSRVTPDLVLVAVLLGLHQNVNHDRYLIGSWPQHFRGSVHLLEAAAKSNLPEFTYAHLSRLIEVQAVSTSLRLELPFSLPTRMCRSLAEGQDPRTRAMHLGSQAADLCAAMRKSQFGSCVEPRCNLYERYVRLDSAFDRLESDFCIALPFENEPVTAKTYPTWYQLISQHSGGPSTIHTYDQVEHAAIWNAARMARTKLESVARDFIASSQSRLDSARSNADNMMIRAAQVVRCVEDLCASIFFCISHRLDGQQTIASLQDIPGAKAYALVVPLTIARESLGRLPADDGILHRRLWITNLMKTIEERLGISEAWCWGDDEGDDARERVEKALYFGN